MAQLEQDLVTAGVQLDASDEMADSAIYSYTQQVRRLQAFSRGLQAQLQRSREEQSQGTVGHQGVILQLRDELARAEQQLQVLQAAEVQRRGRLTFATPEQIDLRPEASPSPSTNATIGGDLDAIEEQPAVEPTQDYRSFVQSSAQTDLQGVANQIGPLSITDTTMQEVLLDAAPDGGDGGNRKAVVLVVLGIVAALAFGFFLYRRKRKRS